MAPFFVRFFVIASEAKQSIPFLGQVGLLRSARNDGHKGSSPLQASLIFEPPDYGSGAVLLAALIPQFAGLAQR
jgi:hypothetical protein